jgi:hypothetical protein
MSGKHLRSTLRIRMVVFRDRGTGKWKDVIQRIPTFSYKTYKFWESTVQNDIDIGVRRHDG